MNRHVLTAMALALGPALALAACKPAATGDSTPTAGMDSSSGVANGTGMAGGSGNSTVPSYPGTKLAATLDGKGEVPGPGAMTGSGEATVWADTDQGKICYILGVAGIDAPTAAHIHKGAAGTAGDVVVPLESPAAMTSQGCADADPGVVKDLAANPADYYINVHNEKFPMGAIRGQLKAVKAG